MDESEQLGMHIATATRRLQKAVILMLVQKVGLDVCFRCGKKIETPQELSMDHKVAWRNVNPTLFWDLDNIAFSHLSCNSKESRHAKSLHAPKGTAWCGAHKAYLPVNQFYHNASTVNGYASDCAECFETRRRK
jgi:HNH endonuclease